jgi:deferrochelatase/peroxidase EfeB
MPVDLSRGPIDPQDSVYQNMLDNLQGNILLAQKRNHTLHIFLKFKAGAAHADVRNWLHAFVDKWPVTSAKEQPAETGEQLFCNVFLSATGYQALGYTEEEIKCKFPIRLLLHSHPAGRSISPPPTCRRKHTAAPGCYSRCQPRIH